MSRREFLKQLSIAGAAGLAPELLLANANTAATMGTAPALAELGAYFAHLFV